MVRGWWFWLAALVLSSGVSAWSSASAQTVVIEFDTATSRNFHGVAPKGPRRFTSNGEAQSVVDRVLRYVPMRHKVTAFVTDDAGDVPNAEARVDKAGLRVIGFNQAFMQQIKAQSGSEWSLISIAAHEIGHHAGNHNFLPETCKVNNEVELEADFYAGFALGKMLVKLDDATSALRLLPSEGGCTHPGRLERIAVLKEGWQQATADLITASGGAAPIEEAATASASSVRAASKSSAGSRFKYRRNRDVHGHDIEQSPGVSFDQCALRCEQNDKCKGFSFDRWNGWCFLKDAMPGSVVDAASIIGIKSELDFPLVSKTPVATYRLRGKRFDDKPMSTATADTYKQCEDRCSALEDCMAFTYAKQDKACQLFKETVGYFIDANFDSGFKRQPPDAKAAAVSQSRMETEPNKYFKGHGYKKHDDASPADCAALCLRDAQCKATEYVESERVCRLYQTVEPALETVGTNVSFKR